MKVPERVQTAPRDPGSAKADVALSQREFRHSDVQYSAPYYWAAFVRK
jgi:CHAT domain-containing protein